jgi:hypothetical protein
MSWGDGGMSENGKQWESGPMDSYHIEKGGHQKIIPFQTPPPSLKEDRSRGSEKHNQSSIGAPVAGP